MNYLCVVYNVDVLNCQMMKMSQLIFQIIESFQYRPQIEQITVSVYFDMLFQYLGRWS